MFVFVYSSYHPKLSFPHLVVILTSLETPKTPNNKTAANQVWLYFIRRTTGPGYAGTAPNRQIVLNTQKNPFLNQANQKNTCQILLPKKIPESKISNPKKILRSSPSLKIRSSPPPPPPHLGCSPKGEEPKGVTAI